MEFLSILYCVLWWLFLCLSNGFTFSTTGECSIPGEAGARCVDLPACAHLVALLRESTTTELALNMTLERSCGFDGRNLKVCCPAEQTGNLHNMRYLPEDTSDFVDQLPKPGVCGRTLLVFLSDETETTTVISESRDDQEGNDILAVYHGNDVNTRVLSQWMALLGYKDDVTWQCGGTIITKKHILTAAHCIRESLFVVRVGELDLADSDSNGGPIDFLVKKMIRHEQYTKYHNDVGIVVLDGIIDYESDDTSWYIGPVCLPLPGSLSGPKELKNTYITGWGETHNGRATHLQAANVTIIDQRACEEEYGKETIDDSTFCAGDAQNGRDACDGDSGGPLVGIYTAPGEDFYHYQLGVISFGFRCSAHRFMGVYMNVTQYLPWILEKVLGDRNYTDLH